MLTPFAQGRLDFPRFLPFFFFDEGFVASFDFFTSAFFLAFAPRLRDFCAAISLERSSAQPSPSTSSIVPCK